MRYDGLTVLALAICVAAPGSASAAAASDVDEIVRHSARVTDADQKASVNYDHCETDLQKDGSTKTYAVHMLFGSPYQELIAVNGEPLPKDQQEHQRRRLDRERAQRRAESSERRDDRIAAFQKEQNRNRKFMQELTNALNFKLVGEGQLGGRDVYVVAATPRPDFHPNDNASKVLTGMRGTLWIDKETYQWVKVEADVVRPVSIDGFVARVEPGTRFELEKMPVDGNVWLPKHFEMTSKAKILSFVPHNNVEREDYFGYRKVTQESTEENFKK